MLKPNQAMVVSVIRVDKEWHVILVEGYELCLGLSGGVVLDAIRHSSSVCDDIRFYVDKTDSGEEGIFVVLN